MSLESDIYTALSSITTSKVYPDIAPDEAVPPYLTYQQVGGDPVNFLSGIPSKRNARIQVNSWSTTRLEAMLLIRLVEDTMRSNATLNATTLGGATATFEPETKLYGALQDFSVWF
jgi:hypothetical protein